jgi:ATP-dependent RNA helicase RhlE
MVIKKTQKNSNQSRTNSQNSTKNKFSGNKNKPVKQLNSNLFIKKATAKEEIQYVSKRTILELPVNKDIIANLTRKGYISPTEIQDKSIEAILNGKDLLGLAKTGTGKTGAYLIPIVHSLIEKKPSFQVLIISPTRELALQIEEEYKSISLGLKLFSTCLIGGTSVQRDLSNLRRPSHVVIGTPGRLSDMVRQKSLNLNNFSVLVLDEFDRLLDMGFSHDIQNIVNGMTNRKQTILFSATEDKGQKQMIVKLLKNPAEVKLNVGNASPNSIDQEIIRIKDNENKMDVLLKMLQDPSFEKVLVFAETKRWVSKVCKNLRKAGVKADEIHGNKSQNYRTKALHDFKNEKIKVLVATDVASRGLDIVDVSHVINYQQPQNIDSYIHRIGRTGRAGKSGKAYTFVN